MEYRIVRSILFVVPGREIDHFQAETIIRYTEGLLRQQCFRLLVFDLADTVFMDSAGVGMMIGLYGKQWAWGGAVYTFACRAGFGGFTGWPGCIKLFRVMKMKRSFWQQWKRRSRG